MIRLRTLGECHAEIDGTRLGPEAERLFAVLLCLAIESGRLSERAALISLLWPDTAEEKAAHNLRQALYRLRALHVPVRSDRARVWVEPEDLDADFASLLFGSAELEHEADRLGGSFLPGYHPTFSAPFAEWIDRQRDIINARLRRAYLASMARHRVRGDWGAVELTAARCLAIDPLNEEATLAKAEAAALQGGKTQALAILDGYLKEVGPAGREIRIPATVLRRRIAEATNLEPTRAITDAPFIGRAEEMSELNGALQLAAAGAGSAHLLWGEPGIGKTRLLQEFTRACSLGHVQVVRVGCQSSDERRPLSMFVDLVPRLLALPGSLGCSPAAMRQLRRLIEHEADAPEELPAPRDAAALYAALRRAILDLLDAVAGESLLVIIVEDVHWLDGASWDVAADVAAWIDTRRLLLLCSSRESDPERRHGIGDVPSIQRHHIRPLRRAAVEELTAALQERSGAALAPDLAEWCASSCGGNPYHLTELVLHGLREGRIAAIPATLSQLITERLARLQPLSLHVLQACAVLGAHSTLERVEAVLHQRRVDLLEALDELEQSGLVVADGSRVESKHELLSQAALQRLSQLSRKLLHRHAALSLEGEDEDTTIQWSCAEHWREAGDVIQALAYVRSCARHAVDVGLPQNAEELLERATTLAESPEQLRELERVQALAHSVSGRWEKVLPLLSDDRRCHQEDEARTHDESELIAVEAEFRCGKNQRALLERLRQCVASPLASHEHRSRALLLTLILADNALYPAYAHHAYEAFTELLSDSHVNLLTRLSIESIYHASFGDHSRAELAAREHIEVARAASPDRQVRALQFGGQVYRICGRLHESYDAYRAAVQVALSNGLEYSARSTTVSLVWAHLSDGDVAGARRWRDRLGELGSEELVLSTRTAQALALFELKASDPGMARQYLLRCSPASTESEEDRAAIQHLALSIAAAKETREGVLTAEVEKLLSLFSRAQFHAGFEFAAGTLAQSLREIGRLESAQRLIGEYLVHRRERYDYPAFIPRELLA